MKNLLSLTVSFVQMCFFSAPKGLPLKLIALGAPHRTVLTQGSKGETTQNPCVKIVLCGGLFAVSFAGSQSVIVHMFLIDLVMFLAKSTLVHSIVS